MAIETSQIKSSTLPHSHQRPLTFTTFSFVKLSDSSNGHCVKVGNRSTRLWLYLARALVVYASVRTLICSFGANPTIYELDEHPEGKKIEKELKALGCKTSVPAVFIGQELVGGAKEIMSMHLKGKLVPLLFKERAIWL